MGNHEAEHEIATSLMSRAAACPWTLLRGSRGGQHYAAQVENGRVGLRTGFARSCDGSAAMRHLPSGHLANMESEHRGKQSHVRPRYPQRAGSQALDGWTRGN